jgi:H+/gluconate symporter-like permease
MAAMPENARPAILCPWVEFVGNRNVALIFGAVIAMWVLARQKGYTVARICSLIGPPLETAGTIILITSAGGAFGLMLKNAGVGDAVQTGRPDARSASCCLPGW